MSHTWLVVDVSNAAWRAFHVFRDLSHGKVMTGVVFGVLRDVERLMRMHAANGVCFCFDQGGREARRKVFVGYKRRHDTFTKEQLAARAELRKQIQLLREDYLPSAGFTNIFGADGFEADDVIAKLVEDLPDDHRAVVFSSDKDLYQLIRENVVMWDGKQMVTEARFKEEWGIEPKDWKYVKALAGCASDTIPGCARVGETTAAKYIAEGRVGEKTDAAIKAFLKSPDFKRNLQLVTLPFMDGCPAFHPAYEKFDLKKWDALMKRLGINSLKGVK